MFILQVTIIEAVGEVGQTLSQFGKNATKLESTLSQNRRYFKPSIMPKIQQEPRTENLSLNSQKKSNDFVSYVSNRELDLEKVGPSIQGSLWKEIAEN